MRPLSSVIAMLLTLAASCQSADDKTISQPVAVQEMRAISKDNPFKKIEEIPLPEGFRRIAAEENSFAAWMRNLTLKSDKTVFLYNGGLKRNQTVQYAVIDMSRGDKDLQQCADAVMRLRAEFFVMQNSLTEFASPIMKEGNMHLLRLTTVNIFSSTWKRFSECAAAHLYRNR